MDQGHHSWSHVILVSAQVPLVLTLGLWTLDFGLGLDKKMTFVISDLTPPPIFKKDDKLFYFLFLVLYHILVTL